MAMGATAAARHVVILADGAVPSRTVLDTAWPGWDDGLQLVIAADGGARQAQVLELRIDRWVGDGDSTDAATLDRLEADAVAMLRVPAEKDESDTELALLEAIREGARAITILGAMGGVRLDHAFANVGLLRHPAVGDRRVVLFDERGTRLSLLEAPADEAAFAGHRGDVVTLLPVGETAVGVTTGGLRYPLGDEPLELGRTRGLSNVRTAAEARISLRSGRLLVIETPATVRP
jgi:thiamine pyrophosphokinase